MIHELIKSERINAGLTQQELADLLKVKRPYVSAIEAGSENLTIESLNKIALVLGKQLDIRFKKLLLK